MFFVVNIGNTNTSVAVARGCNVGRVFRTRSASTKACDVERLLKKAAGKRMVDSSIVSCVVPRLQALWVKKLKEITGSVPVVLKPGVVNAGVKIGYHQPETLGADRLANAEAVARTSKLPAIVVDAGTAITVDAVSAKGVFLGGVILPGVSLLSQYLHERTALLPPIDVEKAFSRKRLIGKSTAQGLETGLKLGFDGMVREVVKAMKTEMRVRSVTLIATGGDARKVAGIPGMEFVVDSKLTLKGLAAIHEGSQWRGKIME